MVEYGGAEDWVRLLGMVFYACHGVNEWEKVAPSRLEVDVEMKTDLSRPGRSDDLAETIDYGAVYAAVAEVMNGESRNLLERLGTQIAVKVLTGWPCELVRVRVRKPHPPIGGVCATAEIELVRSTNGTDIPWAG